MIIQLLNRRLHHIYHNYLQSTMNKYEPPTGDSSQKARVYIHTPSTNPTEA